MLDIKLIRNDPKGIEAKLKAKDPDVSVEPILKMDEEIRHIKNEVEQLKNKKKQNAKQIGEKKRKGEDVSHLMNETAGVGDTIQKLDHKLSELEKTLQNQLACFPNLPMEDIKSSLDPKDNVCIKIVGEKARSWHQASHSD